MNITLEEARTLDAVVRYGSFARAAQSLHKSHSAVIYSMKAFETQTGLNILDRSQYRTSLTPVGKRVWEQCKRLISAEQDIVNLCQELGSGWEPFLKIVVDGLIPFESILKALEVLKRRKIPTVIKIYEQFLSGLENSSDSEDADIFISVVPPHRTGIESIRLCPISSYLVVHRDHPLASTRKKWRSEQLQEHSFLTVRGSDAQMILPTSVFENASAYHLNDFHSKKSAILQGLGFGWLPEYLIDKEISNKKLKIIHWEKSSVYTYFPQIYCREKKLLGKAGQAFINAFLSFQRIPKCEECSVVPAIRKGIEKSKSI